MKIQITADQKTLLLDILDQVDVGELFDIDDIESLDRENIRIQDLIRIIENAV